VYAVGKMVETAHVNLRRIRLVWSRIWSVLAPFFGWVGTHPNANVASFAVDSLRQLSMKFLERDELSMFSFQNDFLRPFVTVMRGAEHASVREMVVRCMAHMVAARVHNIKSGWTPMFMVFACAAADESIQVVRLGFDTIERIVRSHFAHITDADAQAFTDCVNTLVAFANNEYDTDVALNAIAFLRFCAIQLAEGQVTDDGPPEEKLVGEGTGPNTWSDVAAPSSSPPRSQPSPTASPTRHHSTSKDTHHPQQQNNYDLPQLHFWIPILAGLADLSFDPQPVIQRSALAVLFDILRVHAEAFSTPAWERIFYLVLLPMLDGVRHASHDYSGHGGHLDHDHDHDDGYHLYPHGGGNSRSTTTTDPSPDTHPERLEISEECLRLMVDFVSDHVTVGLLPLTSRVAHTLLDLVGHGGDTPTATLGMAYLSRLMIQTGESLEDEQWREILHDTVRTLQGLIPELSVFEAVMDIAGMGIRGSGSGPDEDEDQDQDLEFRRAAAHSNHTTTPLSLSSPPRSLPSLGSHRSLSGHRQVTANPTTSGPQTHHGASALLFADLVQRIELSRVVLDHFGAMVSARSERLGRSGADPRLMEIVVDGFRHAASTAARVNTDADCRTRFQVTRITLPYSTER
jgi:brefeldin A-inhibited guanine nucleotide-exchange protein